MSTPGFTKIEDDASLPSREDVEQQQQAVESATTKASSWRKASNKVAADTEEATNVQKEFQADDNGAADNTRRKKLAWMTAATMLLVLVIGLVVGITLGGRKSGDSSNKEVSSATNTDTDVDPPTPSTPKEAFVLTLPGYTQEALAEDSSSAQSLALNWLWDSETFESLEEGRKTQLFAVITLYYSFYLLNYDLYPQEANRTTDDYYWPTSFDDWKRDDFLDCGTGPPLEIPVDISPKVCNEANQLVELDLHFPNTAASYQMPPELGLLTSLERLAITVERGDANVPITNWLPPQSLVELTALKTLEIPMSDFTGTIPNDLPPALTSLNLGRNRLQGSIPQALPLSLVQVDLIRNALSGTIPQDLPVSLTKLDLWINNVQGPIPTTIGHVTNLEYMDFARNDVSGPLPSQMGLLTKLQSLYAYDNSMAGSIPSQMGALTSLESLELARNTELGGPLPSQMGQMTNLQKLQLQVCDLTGSIPLEWSALSKLEHLILFNNSLTGRIDMVGSMSSLKYLYLDQNALVGSLTTELGQLTHLERLVLDENRLSGSLPSQVGALTGLMYLGLGQNRLSDQLPSDLARLTSLVELDLSGNTNLSGPVPLDMFDGMNNLRLVNISGTKLSGTVPHKLCALKTWPGACFTSRSVRENVGWDTTVQRPCGIVFDCSDILCGCDCPCPEQ